MAKKGSSFQVTVELSELELALLYHAATQDPGEYRAVFWRVEGVERPERHFVSPRWLESKVFGQIARSQPEALAAMESAQKRLTPHEK